MVTFNLDRASPIPLYYQLQQQLREAIRDGRLGVNAALPTEPELAANVGVSRFTLRQAIDQLVRDGLLRRERGRGTFVAEPPLVPIAPRRPGFAIDPDEQGADQVSRVLRVAAITPDPDVRKALGLEEGTEIVEIVRLRLLEGQPIALETMYMPASLVPGLEWADVTNRRLYDVLERRYGLRVTHAQQVLRAVTLEGRTAEQLGEKPGSAGFFIERCTYAGTTAVELRRTYVRDGEGRFQLALSRPELVKD